VCVESHGIRYFVLKSMDEVENTSHYMAMIICV
jgi:hypothetical protein